MDEQAFLLMMQQITRIEKTVDRLEEKVGALNSFKSYVMGVGAAFGMIGAWLYSQIKGY